MTMIFQLTCFCTPYHVSPRASLGAQFISAEIASKGAVATQHTVVRNMRAVKKEVLKLVECFVESAQVSGTCVLHIFLPNNC